MITQFTIGCSRTINLGNFESVRVEASVTIDVTDPEVNDEKYLNEKAAAQKELRKLLEETYKNQYLDRKKIAG